MSEPDPKESPLLDDDPDPTESVPFKVFKTADEYEAALAEARHKGKRAGRREASMTDDERAELAAYRDAQKAAEEERLAAEGKWQDLQSSLKEAHKKDLDQREQRIQELRSKLEHDRCYLALVQAASANAFNPSQVAKMLADRVRLADDGEPEVLDEKGRPRLKSGSGEPFTPADLVAEFLAAEDNANLVKPSHEDGGAGAAGSVRVPSDARVAQLEKEIADLREAAKGRPTQQDGVKILQLHRELETRRKALRDRTRAS